MHYQLQHAYYNSSPMVPRGSTAHPNGELTWLRLVDGKPCTQEAG